MFSVNITFPTITARYGITKKQKNSQGLWKKVVLAVY